MSYLKDGTTKAYVDAVVGVNSTQLTSGILTMPRSQASRGAYNYDGVADSTLMLTYVYPSEDIDIDNLMCFTREAGTGTPTLARMGVYSVDGAGDLALLASTTSDATILTTAWTGHYKALSTTVRLVAGSVYAFAFVGVGTTMMPGFYGINGPSGEFALDPAVCGKVDSSTDLPSTVDFGDIDPVGVALYMRGY